MPRVCLIVLDSVGIGGAPDAAAFGDAGADTVGHIAEACAAGRGDRAGLRAGPLHLPHLDALGLGAAHLLATGAPLPGFRDRPTAGVAAAATEISKGKDTTTGHWELAGTPVPYDWGYFPDTRPSFPPGLLAAIAAEAGVPGLIGDRHASGVAIIEELGAESLATGQPIAYTSVDSCLQIAASEEHFGLDRLYALCKVARRHVDPLMIGRVIARPFVGDAPGRFKRTPNRKDFAMPPPAGTILDRAVAAGRAVVSIGKIGDIFAHRGTGDERKGVSNDDHIGMTAAALDSVPDGGLIFINLVDFDTEYGHRRDVPGYAACLEAFDRRLPDLLVRLKDGDRLIITADHGNDPTWRGTDHTRERVPVLIAGPGLAANTAGVRGTFADVAATTLDILGLRADGRGTSIL
jgi:phosphopentomutase